MKIKIILLLTISLLLILISGCLENLISNKYDVKIKNISVGKTYSPNAKYYTINIIVTNNDKAKETSFNIAIVGITYSDGTQVGEILLPPPECTETFARRSIGFTLLPNSHDELSFCFSSITWEKNPKLYIKIVDNSNNANELLLQLSDVNKTMLQLTPIQAPKDLCNPPDCILIQ